MKQSRLAVVIGALLAATALPAFAVTDDEANASFQFSFVPPGARALGMGGAFVGRADDATAAYTNPAGLTQLTTFEISFEGRRSNFASPYASGGTFSADPFSTANTGQDRTDDSATGLSYLSVVWPHERWSVALYRHEFAQYKADFGPTQRVDLEGEDFFILPYSVDSELDIVNYGISGAFKVNDQFSIGASVIYSDFEFNSVTLRPDANFGSSQDGDDDDIAFNLGALLRISDKLQIGGVYRKGGEFQYNADLFATDASGNPTDFAGGSFPKQTDFDTPDVFGIGLSYQPTPSWTLTFDVNRVAYGDLTENVISGFRQDNNPDPASVDPLKIDDGTELRFGAEYLFLNMARPLSLRGGVWRDPEHTIRFRGDPDLSPTSNALSNAVLFSTGDDEIHYSVGAGLIFDWGQIDAAADFSDNVDSFAVSGVIRFD